MNSGTGQVLTRPQGTGVGVISPRVHPFLVCNPLLCVRCAGKSKSMSINKELTNQEEERLNSGVDPMAPPSRNATGRSEEMDVDGQRIDSLPASRETVARLFTHLHRERMNSLPTVTGNQTPMERLGSKIAELADFIEDKKNIHHKIRELVKSIGTAYKLASKAPPMLATTTRTSPLVTQTKSCDAMDTGPVEDDKSITDDNGKDRSRTAKRKQRHSPDLTDTQAKKKKDQKPSPPKTKPVQSSGKEEEVKWQKVQSKQEKRRQTKEQPSKQPTNKPRPEPKRKKPRKWTKPDALIVLPKENVKYSDVLTRIKAAVPKDQICDVDKIRMTAAGNMLITLSKKSTDKGLALQKTIAGALLDDAAVISKGPQEELEIRDLDEVTTQDDVQKALKEAAGDGIEILTNAIRVRAAFSRTQTARVTLPVATARKIVGENGKIRIGMVNCRIRIVRRPRPCYKCWHYGHVVAQCKSGTDRSKLCMKCGQSDHKAAKCPNKAKCLLCAEKSDLKDIYHQAGSSKCAVFQEALQKITNNRA